MNRWYARRHRIVLAMLALLALDAGVYFGWVRRPAAEPEFDPARLERLTQEVSQLAAEVARLERVREQAPRFRPQLEKFAAERFPAERVVSSRVGAELGAAAEEAGVVLGRASYERAPERNQPDLVRVDITTSVEGAYADLLRYLDELERSPHLYLINELNVDGTQRGQVRLQMRVATYFRRSGA
jgi:Tfp pilus assembly protein PilO